MSLALTPLQRDVSSVIEEWVARRDLWGAARARLDGDQTDPALWAGDDRLWKELIELGVLAVHLPEEVGGIGGSIADAAVVAADLAAAGCALPATTTVMASALVTLSDAPERDELLTRFAEGARGAVAWAGPGAPVLCGPEADLIVAPHDGGWALVTADVAGHIGVDLTRSIGPLPQQVDVVATLPGLTDDLVRDVAICFGTAELAGLARWGTTITVDYVKVREQFDQVIGKFQAIKHLCAEMEINTQLIASAAWDLAESLAAGSDDSHWVAAATAAAALPAAIEVTKSVIQLHGGIGYTWEHDAPIGLRRAKMWQSLLGHESQWSVALGKQIAGGWERSSVQVNAGVELSEDILSSIAEVAAAPEADRRRLMVDAGLLRPTWDRPVGLSASPAEAMAIRDRMIAAGIEIPDLSIAGWVVPPIVRAGTDEQKERFLRASLLGDITWCQLFSEPNAGSDLAGLRTRATRTEGGWKLNGQKVWTSNAHKSDFGLCLARTDPDAPKHKGITVFLVDMTSPGIDIRPLREAHGANLFNEVFLDDVFVPDDCRLGEPGQGWKLATGTLSQERVDMGTGVGPTGDMQRLIGLVAERGAQWHGLLGDLVARTWAKVAGQRRMTLQALDGLVPDGNLATVTKLIGVAVEQDTREALVTVLGPEGALAEGEGENALVRFLSSRQLSIAGGSTQILKNVLAERGLGLPR